MTTLLQRGAAMLPRFGSTMGTSMVNVQRLAERVSRRRAALPGRAAG